MTVALYRIDGVVHMRRVRGSDEGLCGKEGQKAVWRNKAELSLLILELSSAARKVLVSRQDTASRKRACKTEKTKRKAPVIRYGIPAGNLHPHLLLIAACLEAQKDRRITDDLD